MNPASITSSTSKDSLYVVSSAYFTIIFIDPNAIKPPPPDPEPEEEEEPEPEPVDDPFMPN